MKWISIFVIAFALPASAKTIEQVDLEWKARSLKAKEAVEGFKLVESTPAYQSQAMILESAFSQMLDPNIAFVQRGGGVRTYHLLFIYGESREPVKITYNYNETTGVLRDMTIFEVPDSVRVTLPTKPDGNNMVMLITGTPGHDNFEIIFFSRVDPFDILYAPKGKRIQIDGEYDF